MSTVPTPEGWQFAVSELERLQKVEAELEEVKIQSAKKDHLLELKEDKLKECQVKISSLEKKVKELEEKIDNFVTEEETEVVHGMSGDNDHAQVFESVPSAEDDKEDDSEFGGIQIVETRSLSTDEASGPSVSFPTAPPPRTAIFGQFTTTNDCSSDNDTRDDPLPPPPKHVGDPDNPLRCICGYTAVNKYNLTKHIVDPKFSCATCPQKFVHFALLRKHYLESHKDIRRYKAMKHATGCSKCGRTFSNLKECRTHHRMSPSCTTTKPGAPFFVEEFFDY